TGWPIGANCLGIEHLPVKHGSCTRAAPGWDVRVLEAEAVGEAREMKPGDIGALSIKLPLPPGALPTLWQQDERFVDSYRRTSPGSYQTANAGFIDEDGYIQVMTRTDDIINVAGHRLSTGGMEEVLAAHPDVAECAVMGVADALKGQVPLGLLVLKAGVNRPAEDIAEEAVGLVRQRIGPVASFRTALVVERLPTTRSGKILRGTMTPIALGDGDHRRPQQPVVQDIARLQDLDDHAGFGAGAFHLEDRLVEVVVEALAFRVDALQPVALEGGQQFALGRRDTFEQAFRARVQDLRFRHAVERAAQIVDRREQVAGKVADRVFLSVLALALGAAADVLGLGERPQQPVLGVGELGLE